jgi:hypothetical protein
VLLHRNVIANVLQSKLERSGHGSLGRRAACLCLRAAALPYLAFTVNMMLSAPAEKHLIPNPVISGSHELAKHKVNSFPAVNTVQRAGKPSGLQHCRLVASENLGRRRHGGDQRVAKL